MIFFLSGVIRLVSLVSFVSHLVAKQLPHIDIQARVPSS